MVDPYTFLGTVQGDFTPSFEPVPVPTDQRVKLFLISLCYFYFKLEKIDSLGSHMKKLGVKNLVGLSLF